MVCCEPGHLLVTSSASPVRGGDVTAETQVSALVLGSGAAEGSEERRDRHAAEKRGWCAAEVRGRCPGWPRSAGAGDGNPAPAKLALHQGGGCFRPMLQLPAA